MRDHRFLDVVDGTLSDIPDHGGGSTASVP